MKIMKFCKFVVVVAIVLAFDAFLWQIASSQQTKEKNQANYSLFDDFGDCELEIQMEDVTESGFILDFDDFEEHTDISECQQLPEKRGRQTALIDVLDFMRHPESAEELIQEILFIGKPPQKGIIWNAILNNPN